MRTRVVALLYVLHCCDAVRPVAVPRRTDAPPTNVALPTVAVAISGAVRSFATVPVLRSLKRLVLQQPSYSTKAFAALSYDTVSPQPMDYNATLLRGLSLAITVRRAVAHLKPELLPGNVVYYNHSEASMRFRSCRPAPSGADSGDDTDILALYGMQLVFSLVRRYELARGDERFDFILRVRPDHLFMKPLSSAIHLNVTSWPSDRLLTFASPGGSDEAVSFAIVPSGPLAATYFRTFTAASACLFREPNGPEYRAIALPPLPRAPAITGCASLRSFERLASCVIRTNLALHGFPPARVVRHRPALLARVCNLNSTTLSPAWPAWPMPQGETCVTVLDALKRPSAGVTAALLRGEGGANDATWTATVVLVVLAVAAAAVAFRERLLADAEALWEAASPVVAPYTEAAAAAYASARQEIERLAAAGGPSAATQSGPYVPASAVDDEESD